MGVCRQIQIFATHLHELSKLEEIVEIKSILHKHLEISYNKDSDKITYIRKKYKVSTLKNSGI